MNLWYVQFVQGCRVEGVDVIWGLLVGIWKRQEFGISLSDILSLVLERLNNIASRPLSFKS